MAYKESLARDMQPLIETFVYERSVPSSDGSIKRLYASVTFEVAPIDLVASYIPPPEPSPPTKKGRAKAARDAPPRQENEEEPFPGSSSDPSNNVMITINRSARTSLSAAEQQVSAHWP